MTRTPTPGAPRAPWHTLAACRAPGVDPEIFYASGTTSNAILVDEARRTCHGCPVRAACLTAAYEERDEWGIRAGLTHRQRQSALRAAGGVIPRAVADATGDLVLLLRHIYQQHTLPDDGHMVWFGQPFIKVQGRTYTAQRLAFVAVHDRTPCGHVIRTCDYEGCVAAACLADAVIRRDRRAAA